jgi:branched-chain amino acid transport system ATP-binding protein
MTAPPLLELREVGVAIGPHEILRGVSLAVAPGEIVAVLGANGAGKTTLMRTVSGLYRATHGRIVLDGDDIAALPSHAIVARGIGQAPEGRQIFPTMSVRENLVLGAGPARGAALREGLDGVLAHFPALVPRMAQLAGSLSGGEQQMLCIGRALMRRPRVLLLDEPSLGLAPLVVRQIFGLLRRIRDGGVALLLVEQNARAALAVADRGVVLDGGRVVHAGPAGALRDDPKVRAAYLGG